MEVFGAALLEWATDDGFCGSLFTHRLIYEVHPSGIMNRYVSIVVVASERYGSVVVCITSVLFMLTSLGTLYLPGRAIRQSGTCVKWYNKRRNPSAVVKASDTISMCRLLGMDCEGCLVRGMDEISFRFICPNRRLDRSIERVWSETTAGGGVA